MAMIQRLLAWLGWESPWFSAEEFEERVGRRPCTDCLFDNMIRPPGTHELYCDYDLDAYYDAVLA